MASSVDVSVEALQECIVQEITLEGQEIYVSPLTMSENLTKMAHKIDFAKIENDDSTQGTAYLTDEDETDQEAQPQPITQPPLWPWESVRNKLRNSLMEMNVLQDLLLIARDKKYMMLDFVEHDIPDNRNGLLLVARKRAMATAVNILNMGLDRMKRNSDVVTKNKSQDFHYELLRLRKNFKLKKSGTRIFGDLSYKSSGSIYHMSGMFEVLKADNESIDSDNIAPYPAVGAPQPSPATSNLSVIIPEELQGQAYIRIFMKDVSENEFNFETFFGQNFSSSTHPVKQNHENLPWQKKLEMAQQIIFCKEAFEKLFLEAHGIKAKIPNISCGNQLVCRLFPNTNLFITFVHHRVGSAKNNKTVAGKVQNGGMLFANEPHDRLLEHCLYQLLRECHLKNAIMPMPHPVSSKLNSFKTEHLIGPGGYSLSHIDTVVEHLSHGTLLESLVKVAKLQAMRQRVADLLDDIALKVQEPQLIVFTSSYFCVQKTAFKVSICFSGFDSVRTSLAIYITHDSIEVACRDAYIHISQGLEELQDVIMKQVAENHISAVIAVARQFNWKVVSTHNEAILTQKRGSLETGTGIIIVSPHHNRELSICCSQSGFQQVMLLRMAKERSHFQNSGISSKWTAALEGFEPVNMKRVPGIHFASKMEKLLALLTYSSE